MLSKIAKWALDPVLPGMGIKLNTSEMLKLNGLKFHFGFRYIHWDHLSSNYYDWLDPDILLLYWKFLWEKIVLGKKNLLTIEYVLSLQLQHTMLSKLVAYFF